MITHLNLTLTQNYAFSDFQKSSFCMVYKLVLDKQRERKKTTTLKHRYKGKDVAAIPGLLWHLQTTQILMYAVAAQRFSVVLQHNDASVGSFSKSTRRFDSLHGPRTTLCQADNGLLSGLMILSLDEQTTGVGRGQLKGHRESYIKHIVIIYFFQTLPCSWHKCHHESDHNWL